MFKRSAKSAAEVLLWLRCRNTARKSRAGTPAIIVSDCNSISPPIAVWCAVMAAWREREGTNGPFRYTFLAGARFAHLRVHSRPSAGGFACARQEAANVGQEPTSLMLSLGSAKETLCRAARGWGAPGEAGAACGAELERPAHAPFSNSPCALPVRDLGIVHAQF